MNATKPIAARAELLRAAGYFDQNSDEDDPSPCISVCRMTEDRSHSEGCFRTIPEIRAWARDNGFIEVKLLSVDRATFVCKKTIAVPGFRCATKRHAPI